MKKVIKTLLILISSILMLTNFVLADTSTQSNLSKSIIDPTTGNSMESNYTQTELDQIRELHNKVVDQGYIT